MDWMLGFGIRYAGTESGSTAYWIWDLGKGMQLLSILMSSFVK